MAVAAHVVEDLFAGFRLRRVEGTQKIGWPFRRFEFMCQNLKPVQVLDPERRFIGCRIEYCAHPERLSDVALQNRVGVAVVVDPNGVRLRTLLRSIRNVPDKGEAYR